MDDFHCGNSTIACCFLVPGLVGKPITKFSSVIFHNNFRRDVRTGRAGRAFGTITRFTFPGKATKPIIRKDLYSAKNFYTCRSYRRKNLSARTKKNKAKNFSISCSRLRRYKFLNFAISRSYRREKISIRAKENRKLSQLPALIVEEIHPTHISKRNRNVRCWYNGKERRNRTNNSGPHYPGNINARFSW